MNNKAASIRTLLAQHPDGLGYDDICRYTGIARDRIGTHIAALITNGDLKPFEFPDRGRVFKYTGDPARTGPRFESQPPVADAAGNRTAAAPTHPAPSTAQREGRQAATAPAAAPTKLPEIPSFSAAPSNAAPRSEGAQSTGLPEAGRTERADAAPSSGRPAEDAAKPTVAPAIPPEKRDDYLRQSAAPQEPASASSSLAPPPDSPPARAADPAPEQPAPRPCSWAEPTAKPPAPAAPAPRSYGEMLAELHRERVEDLIRFCELTDDPLLQKKAQQVRTIAELRDEFMRAMPA